MLQALARFWLPPKRQPVCWGCGVCCKSLVNPLPLQGSSYLLWSPLVRSPISVILVINMSELIPARLASAR